MVKRFFMARQKGFEPLTPWFVAKYSIQLSYWRMLLLSTHILYHKGFALSSVFLKKDYFFICSMWFFFDLYLTK